MSLFTRNHFEVTAGAGGNLQLRPAKRLVDLVGAPVRIEVFAKEPEVRGGEHIGWIRGSKSTCSLIAPFAMKVLESPGDALVVRGEAAGAMNAADYEAFCGGAGQSLPQ